MVASVSSHSVSLVLGQKNFPCFFSYLQLQAVWQRNLVRKYLQSCSLRLQTTVALYPGPVRSQIKQRLSPKGRSGWVWLTLHFSWMDRFLCEAPTEAHALIKALCSRRDFSGGIEAKEGSIRYWNIKWRLIQVAEWFTPFWFNPRSGYTAHHRSEL